MKKKQNRDPYLQKMDAEPKMELSGHNLVQLMCNPQLAKQAKIEMPAVIFASSAIPQIRGGSRVGMRRFMIIRFGAREQRGRSAYRLCAFNTSN